MIAIIGPTACGKTQVAVRVARALGGHVVSADSRQVYRRMDIGTGKDLRDYTLDGQAVPYHLIDIAEPGERYTVYDYQRDFLKVYNSLSPHTEIVLCGGSGLYVESILRAYRLTPVPENKALREALNGKSLGELRALLATYKKLHNTTDADTAGRAIRAIEIADHYKHNPPRDSDFPKIESKTFGLSVPREERRHRISERLSKRLNEGMIEEVEGLLKGGIPAENLLYYGLEYRYVTLYLLGELSLDEMTRRLEIAIHQFAKRQMTYFRGMERRGVPITWIDATRGDPEQIASLILKQKAEP